MANILIVKKTSEYDLSTIDLRTITAEDWEAVKRQIHREAHAERTKAMRDVITWLKCWWPGPKQRRHAVIVMAPPPREI